MGRRRRGVILLDLSSVSDTRLRVEKKKKSFSLAKFSVVVPRNSLIISGDRLWVEKGERGHGRHLPIHCRAGCSEGTGTVHGLSRPRAAPAAETPVLEPRGCPRSHRGPPRPGHSWADAVPSRCCPKLGPVTLWRKCFFPRVGEIVLIGLLFSL